MTDIQVLTLAVAIVIPLSLLLYSNSRISEAKETLHAEIRAETALLRTEMGALEARMEALQKEIRSGFEHMGTMLKIHELEHHK